MSSYAEKFDILGIHVFPPGVCMCVKVYQISVRFNTIFQALKSYGKVGEGGY